MLAVIIFLCGILGLWVNIYSVFGIALFGIYYYAPFKRERWESAASFIGLFLGALNIIVVLITRQF